MPKFLRFNAGDSLYYIGEDGWIERRCGASSFGPSPQWAVTGAYRCNKFGAVVQRFSLKDLFEIGAQIPWTYKNGKARTFIADFDHGSHRMWSNAIYGFSVVDSKPEPFRGWANGRIQQY